MGVEEFDQLGEVGERAGQSVDLVDDFLLCWCPVVPTSAIFPLAAGNLLAARARLRGSTLSRWSRSSLGSSSGCGARSMRKARCSTSWRNDGPNRVTVRPIS
jgi:hypothetical protein